MQEKIRKRTAKLAVLGLGYVGLPLACEFAAAGFSVTGIDPDGEKSRAIKACRSYITDIGDEQLSDVVKSGKFSATTDFSALGAADVIFICVPTPFSRCKEPDVSYIISASRSIRDHLRRGQLIILESTTHPGTTEELVQPILEEGGLVGGVDFHLVFSPERVDPGNRKFGIRNTPKVIGGLNPRDTRLAMDLYSTVIEKNKVVPVSSPKIAEMTKLLENIFRSVNIALINELTLLCDRMDIDIWEVIDAASSKPFGFMPFYPGPGVGGHCIPVDPYYLSWKAREYDFYTKFIELAAEINQSMPRYVVTKISDALNTEGKSIRGAKILALGVTFKENINDARNSPALKVVEELLAKGARLTYHDPYVPAIGGDTGFSADDCHPMPPLRSEKLTERLLQQQDCVVLLVKHGSFKLPFILKHSRLLMDTKNAAKGHKIPAGTRVVKL